MEIVEVNPNLHGSTDVHRTVDMALKLISSAMGADILDINNRHVKGSGGKLHH